MGHMFDLFRKGDYVDNPYKSFFEIRARNHNFEYVQMNKYLQNVLLVINVSPNDKNYEKEMENLNYLRDKFIDEKFNVLAFPTSQLDKVDTSDREMKQKMLEKNILIPSKIHFFNRV